MTRKKDKNSRRNESIRIFRNLNKSRLFQKKQEDNMGNTRNFPRNS